MSALQLGRVWASAPLSPNIDPGAAKYNLGWVAEIPVFQMLNYINNRYDTNTIALAQRGVFEWGNDITYSLAALAWDEVDGFIYVSKVAGPSTASRPGDNAAQWDKSAVQISRKQYDDAVTAWNAHVANTSNPHMLTTEILNTYTKAVIDSKVAVNQANINSHTGNMNNPHAVTAVQAGAVPVTGGNYTGLVRHLFASTGIGASALVCSFLADATGVFLRKGANAKLGIDNLNKAVFVDSAAIKTNLLLESNYLTVREANETSFVAPVPDCRIDFRNSLNLVYGVGPATFTGPAGTRGYLDKSGVAQTAALDAPRFTNNGLHVANSNATEVLSVPTNLNGLNCSNFTLAIDFQPIVNATISHVVYYASGGLAATCGVSIYPANTVVFRSMVGGAQTTHTLGTADYSKSQKVVIVSNSTANKTFVYLDGELKLTLNNSQDYISGAAYVFSVSGTNNGEVYLNSFRSWLQALTAQQVSSL